MVRRILSIASITCLMLLVGCTTIPVEIDAVLGQEFALSPGQSASITSEDLKIEFLSVINDSRCPEGVVCFWRGEVSCLVEISHAGTVIQKVLLQPGSSPADTTFGDYLITFEVQPYPQADKVIAGADYRLHLVINKE